MGADAPLPLPTGVFLLAARQGLKKIKKSLLLIPDTVCGVYHPVKGHHHFP